MHLLLGDLWEVADNPIGGMDAVVITTNGAVRRDGCGVMGRGCAQEAKRRFPSLSLVLGNRIRQYGNHVHVFDVGEPWALVSFPVKAHWGDEADLGLIRSSVQELKEQADRAGWVSVLLPRPGCGNGRRMWSEVEGLLAPLDGRFNVITW